MMAKWYSGTLGPKAFWHLSYRWEKTPRKTAPRKLVPTGGRTRAHCVTSAHATTCSTAVNIYDIDRRIGRKTLWVVECSENGLKQVGDRGVRKFRTCVSANRNSQHSLNYINRVTLEHKVMCLFTRTVELIRMPLLPPPSYSHIPCGWHPIL